MIKFRELYLSLSESFQILDEVNGSTIKRSQASKLNWKMNRRNRMKKIKRYTKTHDNKQRSAKLSRVHRSKRPNYRAIKHI